VGRGGGRGNMGRGGESVKEDEYGRKRGSMGRGGGRGRVWEEVKEDEKEGIWEEGDKGSKQERLSPLKIS